MQGRLFNQTESFSYLGCLICVGGGCEKEIRRIGMTRTPFGNMRKMLTNLNMNRQARERLLRCFVWSSVLMYARHEQLRRI